MVALVAVTSVLGARPVAAQMRPPTAGAVTDPFRAPASPYGPGNRGVEYATAPGSPVTAIGAGRVGFAGPVAGRLVVVVDHGAGLRSSYLPLTEIVVEVGQSVPAGARLGTAGPSVHLGVRLGDRYIDPASLFARRVAPPILVGPHRPGRIDPS